MAIFPIFVSFYFPPLPPLKPLYCLSLCSFLLSSPSTFQPFLCSSLFTIQFFPLLISFSFPLLLQFTSFICLSLSLYFPSTVHSFLLIIIISFPFHNTVHLFPRSITSLGLYLSSLSPVLFFHSSQLFITFFSFGYFSLMSYQPLWAI